MARPRRHGIRTISILPAHRFPISLVFLPSGVPVAKPMGIPAFHSYQGPVAKPKDPLVLFSSNVYPPLPVYFFLSLTSLCRRLTNKPPPLITLASPSLVHPVGLFFVRRLVLAKCMRGRNLTGYPQRCGGC